MTQREKVIKGLECCLSDGAISSAIECLLHPQDADDSDMAKAIDTAVRAMRLLKAQESQATTHEAEWHIFKGQRGATCSYCKHTFDNVYDPENYDYYCRHCGARMVRIRTVKWE